ncbi:MAG: FGGY family carbohydrate kinase [Halobellus sp.]
MSDAAYLGALDQGTGGTRFVVFDDEGTQLSQAFTTNQCQRPAPDRVEYDPLKLWSCATDAIRRGLVQADVDAEELRALGISSQRQTTLLWERDSGRPVTGAVGWQDRRTAEYVSSLSQTERTLIRERTGLEPHAYFAAPTAKWLLDNGGSAGGDVRARAADGEVLLGTIDSWLLYNLTGVHATDVTNAAQTMLFDVYEREWDDALLDLFDVPTAALPTVSPSSDPAAYGTTDPTGILNASVPVTGVIGDQQAALLSRVPVEEHAAKVTYGTGNFFLQNTGTVPVAAEGELLTTIWFQQAGEDPLYGLEGPVFATGDVLEWLRTAGLLDRASGLDQLDTDVGSMSGIQLVPGFGGLGAPFWTGDADTAVFGLNRNDGPEDLLRATVEAIAFGTRAVVEAAERATGVEHCDLLVDGGATQDDAFTQLQADLLDRPLRRSRVSQTTALGAGIAAGIGAGVWDSLEATVPCRPATRTFTPRATNDVVDEAYRHWREVVEAVVDLRCGE